MRWYTERPTKPKPDPVYSIYSGSSFIITHVRELWYVVPATLIWPDVFIKSSALGTWLMTKLPAVLSGSNTLKAIVALASFL